MKGESTERDNWKWGEGRLSGSGRNLIKGKFHESTRMTLAIVDTQPGLTISCDQTGDYPNCHQRAFIQQLVETDTETQ